MTTDDPKLQIPSQLEGALGFNVTRLATLFKRELLVALKAYAITPEQWQVLAALWWSKDQLNQMEICHLTLKDKPTVSRMLAVMETRGWIRRSASKDDGRSNVVRLTKQGKDLRDLVPKDLGQHFEPFLSQLSQEEHDTLLSLIKRLRSAFNDYP